MTQAPKSQPDLFDRQTLATHRSRHQPAALFLHDLARDEVEDRLKLVNRVFKHPSIVTPFSQVWQDSFPKAKIIPDADVLDLRPGSHDLIIHAMGLHWANDPVGQLIQCRRALTEDGLLLAIMLGGRTLHQLRSALAEAETQVCGGLSPRIAPMGEVRDLGGLLQRAGFALPVADVVPLTVEYRDSLHLMRDLRAMGEGNALDDRLPATFELVCLTGWSPSDSQQQPLRPGSAKMRLAEALKVPETKLPD
jgi:hypothetical protein